MVWCCLQKKRHVLVAFVRSIKVQIILTKSLKKNNTQIKKSIFFCGATGQLPPKAASLLCPYLSLSLSLSLSHTRARARAHARTLRLLRTSDQLVADAATYTTRNKHNGQISMFFAGFEHAIPGIKQIQAYGLDRATNGIVPNQWLLA